MARRKTNSRIPVASKSAAAAGRPSALLDTRVIYCGDNLEQLAKLPDGCVDLIYIDPPESSNRNYNCELRSRVVFKHSSRGVVRC
jgi:hypothetical protein